MCVLLARETLLWICGSCDQVRIIQVVKANHYHVMLLEHQVPGQPKRDLQSIYTSLTMDLAMYMSNPQNQEPYCMEQGKLTMCPKLLCTKLPWNNVRLLYAMLHEAK